MNKKNSFTKEELLSCGRGEMFGPGNAQLPLPPMLMFDRIVSITDTGGTNDKGQLVAELDNPLHLQVFVTPTCPYCPQAVILAHQLAFESNMVNGDMVEATEFPQLSFKYHVQGVPRTVINETVFLGGAAPEQMLMAKVQEAISNN